MQTNTYFPPIVDTYNEGFLIEKGQCNIKFTLSPYTDKSNIKTIWVSVRDPKTNKSLVTGAENFEKLEAIYQPAAAILYNDIDGQYTFTLDTRYIQGGWQAEKTYKIQLRFCAASENIKFDTQADVLAHIDDFSEWSSATLVTPTKDFSFTSSSPTLDNQQVMSAYANVISGTVDYGRTGEYLTDYRIVITDNGTPVFDSNYQHTDTTNPNTIRQKLTVGLELGKTYHFKYYFISSNYYKDEREYDVEIELPSGNPPQLKINTQADAENGRVKIILTPDGVPSYSGNFLIKRSSHETNFNYWEDVKTIQVAASKSQEFITYDNSIDSGIWYKYLIVKIDNSNTIRSSVQITQEPVMVMLEDLFLNGNNRQLKVKFNPTINSYQYTLSENATQTIGSKYPFIKRNGKVNYRQIGISGLISYHMDKAESMLVTKSITNEENNAVFSHQWESNGGNLFTTPEELYGGYSDEFSTFNTNNGLNEYNDVILERKFREKVIEFLLDGQVKLLRSPTETPALVRLMNVTFSPNQTLGRMVYSFSATAHEVADYTLENIIKYNIQGDLGYQDIILRPVVYEQAANKSFALQGPLDYNAQPNETLLHNLLDGLNTQTNNDGVFKLSYANNVKLTLDDAHKYYGYLITYDVVNNPYIDYNATTGVKKVIFYYRKPTSSTIYSVVRDPAAVQDFSDLGDINFLSIAIKAADSGQAETILTGSVTCNISGNYVEEDDF